MASFKILRGLSTDLPSEKKDGQVYFCIDTGDLYIDYNDNGIIIRRMVNENVLLNHIHNITYTPSGAVSQPTFTGTEVESGSPSKTSTVASSSHTHKYTPAGTVSQPTFTGSAVNTGAPAGSTPTTSVYSITDVGSTPNLSASVTNRCLTLSFSAGSTPTRSSVTVASSDHTHSVTASGTVSQPTFTGTEASTTSISGTTKVASSGHTHKVTATGNVSQPTFTGTQATITTSAPTEPST